MFGLPPWLLIFPVVAVIVYVHELGHFLAARMFGIKVTEFGFGFPPRIVGVPFKGTVYSINWIPLGGFVRFVGEDDPADPDSLASHSILKRVAVLGAGFFMNILLAAVIFTVLFMLPYDELIGGDVVITAVAPGSPAQLAGVRPGDTVLTVDGRRVLSPAELVDLVRDRLGEPIELGIRRSGAIGGLDVSPDLVPVETVTVVPRVSPPSQKVVEVVTDPAAAEVDVPSNFKLTTNPDGSFRYERGGSEVAIVSETQVSLAAARSYDPDIEVGDTLRQGAIGVMIGLANPKFGKVTDPVWRAVPNSFKAIWGFLVMNWNGLSEAVSSRSNPGTGLIGISQATGEGVSRFGFTWVFQLTAALSVIIGVFNLLPVPPLDGGKLLFVVIEWVRRGKRISSRREGQVSLVGLAMIVGLFLVVSYFDVARLLSGERILPGGP